MKKLFENWKRFVNEAKELVCPAPTQDVGLNTKNRDSTIKNFMYGPLNIREPADYWSKVAKKWNTTEEAARMDECMPGPTSDGEGSLGYCWMHHFKCHSARACTTWAAGGPIQENSVSAEWQSKNDPGKDK